MSEGNTCDTHSSRPPRRESTLLPMLIGGLALALVGMTVIIMFV